jgi:hypothetical protein
MAGRPVGTAVLPACWTLWARSSRRIFSRRLVATGLAVSLAIWGAARGTTGGAKALGDDRHRPSRWILNGVR